MKSRAIVCAIAAATMGFGSLSFAQEHDLSDHRRGEGQRATQRAAQRDYVQRDYVQREYGQRHDGRRGDNRRDNDHRDFQRGYQRDQGHARQYYYNARGPEWRRGGYIPHEYRGRQYIVNDWRGHHLHAPPRGYQWVQVGSDYVMIAIATGIIAQLLINQ